MVMVTIFLSYCSSLDGIIKISRIQDRASIINKQAIERIFVISGDMFGTLELV